MKFDVEKWKEFEVSKIFTLLNGKGITTEEIEENAGNFTVVQSGEENNGVLGKISKAYCKSMSYTMTEKPCLTVARSGSAGFVSFQMEGCVVGDSAKILLLDDDVASTNVYVFLQTVLTANRFKYSYGRKVTEKKYLNDVIDLPVLYNETNNPLHDNSKRFSDKGYLPDWEFIKSYVDSLHHKPLTTQKIDSKLSFDVGDWVEFRFGDLISDIYKGKAINKDDLVETENDNSIRYITRTSDDNGCEMIALLTNIDNSFIEEGNAITIGDTTATCFYQDERFITGDHMVVVRAEWLNKYNAMFIVALLTNEQYKYSYGRAFLMGRIKDTCLKLPANKRDGKYVPDWNYMETYIKSLPYGDRLEG